MTSQRRGGTRMTTCSATTSRATGVMLLILAAQRTGGASVAYPALGRGRRRMRVLCSTLSRHPLCALAGGQQGRAAMPRMSLDIDARVAVPSCVDVL